MVDGHEVVVNQGRKRFDVERCHSIGHPQTNLGNLSNRGVKRVDGAMVVVARGQGEFVVGVARRVRDAAVIVEGLDREVLCSVEIGNPHQAKPLLELSQ